MAKGKQSPDEKLVPDPQWADRVEPNEQGEGVEEEEAPEEAASDA